MFDALQYGFWALAVVLQIAAGAFMIRRNLLRRFPVVFAYLIFQSVRSITLFAILRMGHQPGVYKAYFRFYWMTEVICALLCFSVIVELSRIFFRDYELVRQIVPAALLLGVVGLLALNVLLTASVPGHESHRLISAILLLDRSIAVLQTGLVLILFLSAKLMALPWRRDFSFGISLGLSIVGTTDLAAAFLRAQIGPAGNSIYAVAQTSAYLLAVIVWLVYIFAPQQEDDASTNIKLSPMDIHNWNEALTDIFQE